MLAHGLSSTPRAQPLYSHLAGWVLAYSPLAAAGGPLWYRLWGIMDFLRGLLHRDRATGQAARFVVVGVLNTVVDLGVLYLLMRIPGVPKAGEHGFTYYSTAAKSFSYALGICNSFLWNKYWTFSAGKSQKGWREFGMFVLVNLPPLVVNVVVFGLLGLWTHSGSALAQLGKAFIAAVVAVIWNFLGSRYFAFRHTALKEKSEREQQ
jgi:putative flippase GtrA